MYKTQFARLGAIAAVSLTVSLTGCSTDTPAKSSSSTIESSTIERQAKSSVGSALFNQQTYFLEKKAFANSFGALKEDSINTKDYSYRIILKPDKFKGVAVMATSKNPKLRSYTGVVYVVNSKQLGTVTLSQLCETKEPSKVPPIAPDNPKSVSGKIRCPTGSRSSFELLAWRD